MKVMQSKPLDAGTREQLLAIDQIDERQGLLAQRINDDSCDAQSCSRQLCRGPR